MVEFALVLPVLLILLFGIFEFGYAFGQYLDVRHAAREGTRLAVVDFAGNDVQGGAQSSAIVAETCSRMEMATDATVTISTAEGSSFEQGGFVEVTVSAPAEQVTGFFSAVLDSVNLSSTVQGRIEVNPRFAVPHTEACPS